MTLYRAPPEWGSTPLQPHLGRNTLGLMGAWYENDALWGELQATLFGEKRWQEATADVENIIKLLALPPGASVLDMPCGPGRHALELARRGFRVTGVDRTTRYLDDAREHAATEGLAIEWIQADMRDFGRREACDAAINLWTSFGYFDDPADDRRVLENFFASLKPGGKLVMEMMGKEVLARIFQSRHFERLPDGRLWLEERTLRDDWSRVDVVWTLIDGAVRREYPLSHRLHSASELKSLLAGVGFVRVRAFGSLDGMPYDHEAKRLVVVAEKAR